MDNEIPTIELKLKLQDHYVVSFFLYLLIGLVINTLIYINICIFQKLNKIFNNYTYIDNDY